MRPTMAMRSRKTPTAITPPMMWMLDTMPKPFPQAATLISTRPTFCRMARDRQGETERRTDRVNSTH